jgi:hypothetical protein
MTDYYYYHQSTISTDETLASLLNLPPGATACTPNASSLKHREKRLAVSLEQTAQFLCRAGRIEERTRTGGNKTSGKHLALLRSFVLLDRNGAIASCWIVPVHQAFEWLRDVAIWVHFCWLRRSVDVVVSACWALEQVFKLTWWCSYQSCPTYREVYVNRWSVCVSSREKKVLRMSYLRKAETACQVLTWIQGEIVRRWKTYGLAVLESARGKSNTLEHGHQLVKYPW